VMTNFQYKRAQLINTTQSPQTVFF